MSAITPETQIRLLKVDLTIDETNQLTFNNETAQRNYFLSLPHDEELDNCTYLRKDGIIRYPKNIDSILNYNYVMYKNNNFSNKWFYAFIENMEFANPNMTDIKIKTDVFQTWQFQIQYKRSFVEREHVNNDTIGLHTIPEKLELGDYICETQAETSSTTNCHVVLATTFDVISTITDEPKAAYPYNTFNGIPNGCNYYVCGTETSVSFLDLAINSSASDGKSDGIVGIFLLPDSLLGITNSTTWNLLYRGSSGWSTDPSAGLGYAPYLTISKSDSSVLMETISITKPYSTINGYTPKNKKLFVYPYKYLLGSNNNGSATTYQYELFSGNNISMKIYGAITPGGSIKSIPVNYKNQSENNLESLTGGKYPIGSFNNDVYTNWLTQNGVNLAISASSSLLSTGVGLATGNPIGVASGILGISQTVGEIYSHSLIPPTVEGNMNSGDVNFSTGLTKFSYYKMSIKQEYARVIDEFFSMYGYKVNSVKIPNITGRSNWNYVKTIDCNLEGNIPQNDLNELKSLFNKGLTLWHNPSTFLDYSQNNPITVSDDR